MGSVGTVIAVTAGVLAAGLGAKALIDNSSYSYSTGELSEGSEKEVADRLAEMKQADRVKCEELEKKILDDINSEMEKFLKEVESINGKEYGGVKLSLNLKAIREKSKELESQVIGSISNYMEEKLVLTDEGLKKILKKSDKKKRDTEFQAFCLTCKKEALMLLRGKIEHAVQEQFSSVEGAIQSRIQEADQKAKESSDAWQELLEQAKKDEAGRKEALEKYAYRRDILEMFMECMEK